MPLKPDWRTAALTALAMLAFAGNSLLCRMALRDTTIDAASFTSLRLVSGALVLFVLVRRRHVVRLPVATDAAMTTASAAAMAGDWISASALFVYAAGFSFAYLGLPAATGALLLFGVVQAAMIAWGLWRGERLRLLQWLGLALAAGGLVVLVLPGLAMPSPGAALLMSAAGLGWAVYSLRGRGVADATAATAGNFLRAAPLAIIVSLALWPQARWDGAGVLLALVSGAITSGLGYAVWYTALRGLNATRAAVVQLSVPALAAAGSVGLLGEPLTAQLLLASLALLGGLALVIRGGTRAATVPARRA